MVQQPTNHESFTCFYCKRERCADCHGQPIKILFSMCNVHKYDYCSHSASYEHETTTVELYACESTKCQAWITNFQKRPNACVKQSFMLQVEKMANTASDIEMESFPPAITKGEHSYGKYITIHPVPDPFAIFGPGPWAEIFNYQNNYQMQI